MVDLRFFCFFQHYFSHNRPKLEDDNGILCSVEPLLQLKNFPLSTEIDPGPEVIKHFHVQLSMIFQMLVSIKI